MPLEKLRDRSKLPNGGNPVRLRKIQTFFFIRIDDRKKDHLLRVRERVLPKNSSSSISLDD